MKHVLIVMALFAVVGAVASAQLKPGDAESGKRIFLRNGCYQCHGTVGQGGSGGARLAQTKLTQIALTAYVRNPRSGGMPPYRAKVMSDQELADVFAYIKSLPEPLLPKDIPELKE
jgi:mono/diheme cytochrome c family protein